MSVYYSDAVLAGARLVPVMTMRCITDSLWARGKWVQRLFLCTGQTPPSPRIVDADPFSVAEPTGQDLHSRSHSASSLDSTGSRMPCIGWPSRPICSGATAQVLVGSNRLLPSIPDLFAQGQQRARCHNGRPVLWQWPGRVTCLGRTGVAGDIPDQPICSRRTRLLLSTVFYTQEFWLQLILPTLFAVLLPAIMASARPLGNRLALSIPGQKGR
jgi:hypothetical protein